MKKVILILISFVFLLSGCSVGEPKNSPIVDNREIIEENEYENNSGDPIDIDEEDDEEDEESLWTKIFY